MKTMVIAALANGTYTVTVNGTARTTLSVPVQPQP